MVCADLYPRNSYLLQNLDFSLIAVKLSSGRLPLLLHPRHPEQAQVRWQRHF